MTTTYPVPASDLPRRGVGATLAVTAGGILLLTLQPAVNEVLPALFGFGLHLPPRYQPLAQCFALVAVIAMVMLATRLTGFAVLDYLGLSRPRLRDVLQGIGYGLAAYAAVLLVLFAALVLFATPETSSAAPLVRTSLGVFDKILASLSVLIVGIVAGPVAEELLFRGFMYRGLQPLMGTLSAILLTSLAFGLIHRAYGYGWDWVVVTSFLGLLCGWLRWRSGGIVLPIVAHATFNVFGTAGIATGILFLR